MLGAIKGATIGEPSQQRAGSRLAGARMVTLSERSLHIEHSLATRAEPL